MVSRFGSSLVLLLAAFSVPLPSAAAPEASSSAPAASAEPPPAGQDLLLAPPSDACGQGSEAPCPSPSAPPAQAGAAAPAAAGKSPAVGSAAPAFTLQDLDGKAYAFTPGSLAKPTLVVFWSLFCEPCREEFPTYGKLAKEFGPKGLETVAVNLDGPRMAATARSYLKSLKVSVRVVMDRKEGNRFVAADPYGVSGTPSLFLADRTGKISWLHAGRIAPDKLRAEIQKVLAP